ncbi:MAG: 1-acyl-sn-glycerol-3-phosphate acyltransferase, partial [Candidatus Omnitrophica bacterium]|nr:1-acyl-sn-glycerol-3-phosphate acyltransferase [Candidatus Omnitrophota bacterium]
IFFFPLKVYGQKNIPSKGAFIFASNHRSHLDPILIPICCTRRISFLAKDSLFKNKFFGWYLKQLEAFPIKRESSDIGAIKEIMRRLKRNLPILMFPEGTRVREGEESEVQAGIGLIAVKSGLPVIPIYVSGTDKVFPPGSRTVKRLPALVRFGEPLNFSKSDLPYLKIAQKIMDTVEDLAKR